MQVNGLATAAMMCRLWKKQAWPSKTMLATVSSGSWHPIFAGKLALYEQSVLHAVPEGGLAFSETLEVPTPFAAADVISKEENSGRIQFHYTIVEVAALAADPAAIPQAASDAEDVQWVPVRMLRGFPGEQPPTAPPHWQICFWLIGVVLSSQGLMIAPCQIYTQYPASCNLK